MRSETIEWEPLQYYDIDMEVLAVTRLTVQIEDSKAEALRERAERYGLNTEQFLTASIEDLIGQPDPDFDEAARRVLSRNKELYRRLA